MGQTATERRGGGGEDNMYLMVHVFHEVLTPCCQICTLSYVTHSSTYKG